MHKNLRVKSDNDLISVSLEKGRAKGAGWLPVAVRNPFLYDSFRIVIPTYGASM